MKLSNIIEDYNIHDSKAYKSLSPKMKSAANDLFNALDNEQDNRVDEDFTDNIEKVVMNVCEKHKIEKDELLDYIELEVREQLKQIEV
tara:strand:- start:78 stop:341 length:264 start_codon:yes stop_codon:yes gene_type:complete